MSENEQTNEKCEMMADIMTELRKESKKVRTVTRPDGYGGYEKITLEGNPYFKNLADRIEAAWKRERDLIRSCARWILAHDIYGHMSKELLAECKNVLGDDGQFLNK